MKRTYYKLIIIVLILLLAVGSCRKAGTWLVKKDHTEHADVMVMLTGTLADRVLQTADLYNQNIAPRILIVEAGMGPDSILEERGVHITSISMQVRDVLIQLGIPADSIVFLPGGATSTRMEAEIVRDYLRDPEISIIHSLLLVSSAHHTRRAYKLFRAAMHPIRGSREEAILVSCSPSTYTDFHAEHWWRSSNDIQKVVKEYLKLINFYLFEKRELRKEK